MQIPRSGLTIVANGISTKPMPRSGSIIVEKETARNPIPRSGSIIVDDQQSFNFNQFIPDGIRKQTNRALAIGFGKKIGFMPYDGAFADKQPVGDFFVG